MKNKIKKVIRLLLINGHVMDIIGLPFVLVSAMVLKFVRRGTLGYALKFPRSLKLLRMIGVFPIIDHYYEPMFDPKHLRKPLSAVRTLPAIDWNVTEQLDLLNSFNFRNEFDNIPTNFVNHTTFYFYNGSYGAGDADYWYNIIRLKKPKRIIEIGSGNSTLMARLAIKANQQQDADYACRHICIEPYEMPWLTQIGVELIRKKTEDIDTDFFGMLEANDILFIDSSHVIRPQGDVLFEYLELLPTLRQGVIVHIHDIFSPRDYPKDWVEDSVRLWNEQYLLEAFLSFNKEWKVIGALNLLCNDYFNLLKSKCSCHLTPDCSPGSFYIQRV